MDQRYFKKLRHWAWLFLLAGIAAGGIAYLVSSQQQPVYIAKTRLIVGPGINSLNPDLNALRAGGQLIQTYAELPVTGPFLQGIIAELDLDITPDELKGMIGATSNAETQILSVRVEAENPERAAAIANLVADTLVQMSPSAPGSAASQIREQMFNQAARLEQDIANVEAEILELQRQAQLKQSDRVYQQDVDQQRLMMDRISEERKRLSDTNNSLAMLYGTLQDPIVNQVEILEPVDTVEPVNSQLLLKTAIGAVAGLILSVLAVLMLFYFFDIVDSADDLPQGNGVAFLGAISKHKRLKGAGSNRLAVLALPESATSENYRMLGTKLLSHDTADGRLHSVLFTGDQEGENIGEVAANLAVILAHSGRRVVLVDANFHQPTMDRMFGFNSRSNLVQMLTDRSRAAKSTPFPRAPGVNIVPSGPAVADAFSLLASSNMSDLIEEFEDRADLVIIIGSPVPAYADSLLITSRVDATVFVAQRGKTRRETVSKAVADLRSSGADLVGMVLCGDRRGHGAVSFPVTTATVQKGRPPQKASARGSSFEEVDQEGLLGPTVSS